MSKKDYSIPVKVVKEIGKDYKYDQVILVAWQKETGTTAVTTWGKTQEDCDKAAQGGNYFKREILKWPENDCNAEPNRVIKFKKEVKELKEKWKKFEGKNKKCPKCGYDKVIMFDSDNDFCGKCQNIFPGS